MKKSLRKTTICAMLSAALLFGDIGVVSAANGDALLEVQEGQTIQEEQVIQEGESQAAEEPAVGTEQYWQGYTYKIDPDTLTVEIIRYHEGMETEVTVPDEINGFTVTALASNAFGLDLECVTKVILPASIRSIQPDAFNLHRRDDTDAVIEEVQIDNPYYKTRNGVVYSTDGTELVFVSPNSTGTFNFTKGLQKYPQIFLRYTKIDTLVFEEGVTRIPKIDWRSVDKVVFPSTLEADQVESVVEGSGAGTDIENNAFYFNLFVGDNVLGITHNASEYTFSGENPYYVSVDGVIYNADKTRLVAYPPAKTDVLYRVPSSVKWIMGCAFWKNTYVEEIQLPESVIRIDSEAFMDTTNLKKLNIPKSVHISTGLQYVFSGCSATVYTNFYNMFSPLLVHPETQHSGFQGKVIYNDVHDIQYDPNGGAFEDSEDDRIYWGVEGYRYTLPDDVSRPGYIFKGWYTDRTGGRRITYDDIVSPDGPRTLYAQWSKGYTVTYRLDGGTNNSANPKTYVKVTSAIPLKAPTKKGFTFKGWYTDKAKKNKVTSIPKGSTGNKTYYAKWAVNKYSIAFNGNGGSGSMKKLSCQYSRTYSLPSCTYRKNGYTFAGWNTKKNGTGKKYGDKSSVKGLNSKNGSVVTLYAQWKKRTYTITYNMSGGGANHKGNPSNYNASTGKIILKNPTRKGYTFGGWYSDSGYKKKVTSIPKGSTGNKVFYAKWTANKYTIAFNGNGSTSGTMKKLTACKYGVYYTIPKTAYKKKGYTFTGWDTKANGKGTSYSDQDRQCNYTSINNATVTLYAQWKKTAYTLTYQMDGGSDNGGNPKTYYITTSDITLKKPGVRPGYTFLNWYSDAKKTKVIRSIPKGSTGNKTIYAKWKEHAYSVAFDGNGSAGGSMETLTGKKYSASFMIPGCGYTAAEGFKFIGWNTAKDGSGKEYAEGATVSMLSDKDGGEVVLYAQWGSIRKNLEGRIQDEMAKFPDGRFWNHVVNESGELADKLKYQGTDGERFADHISTASCKNHVSGGVEPIPGMGEYDCNFFDGAIQCDGFAKKIFYDVWEGQRVSGLERNWNAQDVKVGDYVRIKGDSHSAFVIGVEEDTFTVIECNLSGYGPHYNCLIRHNWKYQKSDITYIVRANNYNID